MAREVARDGVTANIILPGRIAPGSVVAFLASRQASYVTGTVQRVDGGLLANI